MLNLDPELRELIIERHKSLLCDRDGENGTRQFLEEKLNEYESLAGLRFYLKRVLFGEFILPEQKCRSPESIEKQLKETEQKMDAIIRDHLPLFFTVQQEWIARRQAVEQGNANRAFSKPWQSVQNGQGKMSGFFQGVIVILVLGFLSLPFLTGKKTSPNFVDKLVPPPQGEQIAQLNDQEKEILLTWHQGALAGRRSYLTGMIHKYASILESAGFKLYRQATLWNRANKPQEALERLKWAGEIAIWLENTYGDQTLKNQVNQLRKSINQTITRKGSIF